MGRGNERFSKKEVRVKKARKRQEKEKKKLERKQSARNGNNLDDMIAYVDQYGNITSEPPEIAGTKLADKDETDSNNAELMSHINHQNKEL